MASRMPRKTVRNPISPEYQEELLATGIVVPLDMHPSFLPGLNATLDVLERSEDSVVAFVVATGRFSNESSAMLVLPDLQTAARVRTAAAYIAGDQRQDMMTRIRAMDLVRLIEEATKIEKIGMRQAPSSQPAVTTALARSSTHNAFPSRRQHRRAVRLISDSSDSAMKGLLAKFTSAFQKGYALGWGEYEPTDMDEEADDLFGQHIDSVLEGYYSFANELDKAGFQVHIDETCGILGGGCGDPLHRAVFFRGRDGSSWQIGADPYLCITPSNELDTERCIGLADGSIPLGEDEWGVCVSDLRDEDWETIQEEMMSRNPRRRHRAPLQRPNRPHRSR